MKRKLFLSSLLTLFVATAWSQEKASPAAMATGKVEDANITISYSSPAVKGRKIWGELVPYGKVLRAGANQATIFETDKDIEVEDKKLPAGKYSLFATPGEAEWQIHFNSQTGQWGTQHDPAKNVLTVTVKPKASSAMNERLLYEINPKGFVLKWENLEIPVKIDD